MTEIRFGEGAPDSGRGWKGLISRLSKRFVISVAVLLEVGWVGGIGWFIWRLF
jgi:hypothetical protein